MVYVLFPGVEEGEERRGQASLRWRRVLGMREERSTSMLMCDLQTHEATVDISFVVRTRARI